MSNLSLVYYVVKDIEFKLNDNQKPNTTYQIKPKIECKVTKKDENLFVNLKLKINEDISSPVPFNLKVVLFGTFKSNGELPMDEASRKAQATEVCAILYPYLRSIVSNLTVNCNIPAYFLPSITAEQLTSVDPIEKTISGNNQDKN